MDKPLLESKTIWAGGLLMAGAAADAIVNKSINQVDITAFLTGLGLVGLRQAVGSSITSPAPAAAPAKP